MRPSRIDDYERGKGKMELENIIRIASVLEISPKVLFEKKEISL